MIFNGPNGQVINDIKPSKLSDLILNNGDQYWTKGSGDAALRTLHIKDEIIFMVRDSLGVFIQYIDKEGIEWVVDGAEEGDVIIQQGGDDWELPKAYFLNKEKSVKILTYFIEKQERPNFVPWTQF